MPRANTWAGDWSSKAVNASATLKSYKRNIVGEINARLRMCDEAKRTSNIAPHIERVIRAPLSGLR